MPAKDLEQEFFGQIALQFSLPSPSLVQKEGTTVLLEFLGKGYESGIGMFTLSGTLEKYDSEARGWELHFRKYYQDEPLKWPYVAKLFDFGFVGTWGNLKWGESFFWWKDFSKPLVSKIDLTAPLLVNTEVDEKIKQAIATGRCTYLVTRKTYKQQLWWNCATCNPQQRLGLCLSCRDNCHKGHKLLTVDTWRIQDQELGFIANCTPLYCDCGIGELLQGGSKCLAIPPDEAIEEEPSDDDEEE